MARPRQNSGVSWKRTAAGAGIGAATGAGLGYGRAVYRHARSSITIMSRTPGAFSRAEKMREAARSAAYAATSPRKSYMFKLQPSAKKLIAGAALAGAAVGIAAAKAWRRGERGGTYYLTTSGKRVYRRR